MDANINDQVDSLEWKIVDEFWNIMFTTNNLTQGWDFPNANQNGIHGYDVWEKAKSKQGNVSEQCAKVYISVRLPMHLFLMLTFFC